jgi:hypothetical protein
MSDKITIEVTFPRIVRDGAFPVAVTGITMLRNGVAINRTVMAHAPTAEKLQTPKEEREHAINVRQVVMALFDQWFEPEII